MIEAEDGVTVKGKLKSVVPEVRMAVRWPVSATKAMLIFRLTLVGEFTVTEFTVMLLPNVALIAVDWKFVFTPVMLTMRLFAPCCPELGVTLDKEGVPAATVKALARVAISEPVVTVTAWKPTTADGAMARSTRALAELVTFTLPTLTPPPNANWVAPDWKCVLKPVIWTPVMFVPWVPVFGNTETNTAGPDVTSNPCAPETANSPPVTRVTVRQP